MEARNRFSTGSIFVSLRQSIISHSFPVSFRYAAIANSNATLLRLAGESNVTIQKRVLMMASVVLSKLLEHLCVT
jgi:hypothetical protein